jgi:hypothetical protein
LFITDVRNIDLASGGHDLKRLGTTAVVLVENTINDDGGICDTF